MDERKDRLHINITVGFRPYTRKGSILGVRFSSIYFLIFETGKSHLPEQHKKDYVFVLSKYESPF